MPMLPITPDAQTNLVQECYAVVYTPRKQRKRFPDNCVEVYDDVDAALQAEDPDNHRYAAQVYGPSRSSEGHMLYYLVRWL